MNAPQTTSTNTRTSFKDLLTPEELSEVTAKSDLQGAIIVLFDWAVVIGLFTWAAMFPNPLTYLAVIILLGGRQMAFGVIVHESGHRSLFKTQALNEFCGTWLSGYWVFSDKDAYMRGHLKHHQDAGTEADPDLKNFVAYPVSRTSLRRKLFRDVTGQIGWRRVKSIGRQLRHLKDLKPQLRKSVLRSVGVNVAMLATLTAFGQPHLYLLWVIAFMTSHMCITRLRQIAEHAGVPDHFDADARHNTRTLYINWLERLLISPHNLNFHLEHHLMASVPIYRLRRLHQILLNKGYYDDVEFTKGYVQLLRQVTYA